ncbi:MAG: class II fructose-bisphosphate aldolase, partial [Pseudomonadota bacterium]
MPLTSLLPLLEAAEARRATALGLVCLGWEDAVAYVRAGEATGVPVILQAGPSARRHIPVRVWGAIFRELGEGA